jgi:type II secretory pathway pseudopilin PulG
VKRRKGFTVIELVIALVILFILIGMAFRSFVYLTEMTQYQKEAMETRSNLQSVLDQMVKELKQTVTENTEEPIGCYGVDHPVYDSSNDSIRDITSISSPDEPLDNSQWLQFKNADTDAGDNDPSAPILQFYTIDDNGNKHRISYTLSVPSDSTSNYKPPHYQGIPRRYWADKRFEPCEMLYSNETWNSTNNQWEGTIVNRPVTDQVVTDFIVIRPWWSDKVIQIIIEGRVPAMNGDGYEVIRLTAQVTLRE